MRSLPVLLSCAGLVLSCFAQAPAPPRCDAPEFGQFDFWVGTWAVESGGKVVGQSRVEKLLDGCLILEHWYGLDGDRGKSLNWYDRQSKVWRQVYVGTGWNVRYQGIGADGGMNFLGRQAGIGSVRLSFTPVPGGAGVRQHKEKQTVAGGEWSTVYDFLYRPATVTQPEAGKHRCTAPETRQFDFWAGDWDVFGPAGRQIGHNRIEPALGGCLLVENWTGVGGASGKSFNYFDRAANAWRQVWVAPGGWLDLSGGFRDGALRYSGETPRSGGSTLERLSFTPSADGSVRQHWEQSTDGGKSWRVAFDGRYVRRKSP